MKTRLSTCLSLALDTFVAAWGSRRLRVSFFALVSIAALSVAVACSGGAGSSLSACPAPEDVAPGGACVSGVACASTLPLPDCPGSAGSVTCNCTLDGWVCVDAYANACYPDAGDEGGGDDGGGDDGEPSEGGDEESADATDEGDAGGDDASNDGPAADADGSTDDASDANEAG